MEHEKVINGKTVGAWKKYAENEYCYTPMAVVKYITILEEELSKLSQHDVIKSVCSCGSKLVKTTNGYYCGNAKCNV